MGGPAMLRKVDQMPAYSSRKHSYVADDIEEFVKAPMRCAEISYEGKGPDAVLQRARAYLKAREIRNVVASKVAGRVYLRKELDRGVHVSRRG